LESFESRIDGLVERCERLDYVTDTTGTLMAVSQGKWLPGFDDVVKEIMALRGAGALYVMCNVLPAGTSVPTHRDWLPGKRCLERWHLVVKNNDYCSWWDKANGVVGMMASRWYGPCPYWLEHRVSNLGSTDRIHLIVDLDIDVEGARYEH